MCDRIRSFLRLRRQNDTVKIMCILALVGMVSFASVLYHVWGIYNYVNTSAEYVLTGEGAVSKKRVDELRQSEGVASVSRQMDCSVTVMYRGTSAKINCTMLSREYLEDMFGSEVLDGTKKIFMNEAAFSEWRQALAEKNEGMAYLDNEGNEGDSEAFDIRYSLAEDSIPAYTQQYKSAKLIVIKDGEKEESFACMPETDGCLMKQAYSLRVKYEKHDLDGLHVETLRKLGYEMENEEIIAAEEYEVSVKLLHIQYGLFLCVVCAIAVCVCKPR
ncbi:MAG: hypothetical protein K2K09_02090 [Lachnospiraceae bacterium]|nr:hypothetical protein [Lachnospiraceae bacterium]